MRGGIRYRKAIHQRLWDSLHPPLSRQVCGLCSTDSKSVPRLGCCTRSCHTKLNSIKRLYKSPNIKEAPQHRLGDVRLAERNGTQLLERFHRGSVVVDRLTDELRDADRAVVAGDWNIFLETERQPVEGALFPRLLGVFIELFCPFLQNILL